MKGLKIVVVEDEFIIQLFISRILKNEGYDVIGEVGTSDDALKLIEQNKPDLILMDIGIKGTRDGIETAKLINEQHQIPIVFITGNSDQSTIDKAMTVNPIGILFKPIDELRLIKNITNLFGEM